MRAKMSFLFNYTSMLKSYLNELLLLIVLKFETLDFKNISRAFWVYHNSFSLLTVSESFVLMNACTFTAINLVQRI